MQNIYSLPPARAKAIVRYLRAAGRYDIELSDVFQAAELARLEAEACGRTWDPERWAAAFCCSAAKKCTEARRRDSEDTDELGALAGPGLDSADPVRLLEAVEAVRALDGWALAAAERAADLTATPTRELARAWKITERQARNRRREVLRRLDGSQGELFPASL
ncbi:MAG: hypothetical protein DI596_03825 [Azospira oryzae]|nr:MAG: hypothetical protein DI596_03825 [Azospira oryzae]PZP81608.1 MAG: hypothetical protein DI593_03825 [Azospira oryzae]